LFFRTNNILRHPLSLGTFQRADKKVSTHHLPLQEESLIQVGDHGAIFSKMVRFKKVEGKPGTHGAHRHITMVCLMALDL